MSRTVVVTGAGSGIGLATTVELARRGYDAVATFPSPGDADAVVAAAAEAGVAVRGELLDVTDAEASRRVVEQERPFALVNNAGYADAGAIRDVPDAEARRQLETMVLAPVRLARLVLPAMEAAGDGRIVTVSSILGSMSVPLMGWYQATKHALEGLMDALRLEVAATGVKVVLVEPGMIDTPIWDGAHDAMAAREDTPYRAAYDRFTALTRLTRPLFSDPDRVARAIADAIDAPSPRQRYYVGLGAHVGRLSYAFTPPVVRDAVTRAMVGV